MTTATKTTVVFLKAFKLDSFDETLTPGEYEIETRILAPAGLTDPKTWTSSVLVRLHTRASHPGLRRELVVPLAELEQALVKDKLTGQALKDLLLEEMLADPMVRLAMQADGVAESDLRDLYSALSGPRSQRGGEAPAASVPSGGDREERGPRTGSSRPGIGE